MIEQVTTVGVSVINSAVIIGVFYRLGRIGARLDGIEEKADTALEEVD